MKMIPLTLLKYLGISQLVVMSFHEAYNAISLEHTGSRWKVLIGELGYPLSSINALLSLLRRSHQH